jgi:hypothetical protein
MRMLLTILIALGLSYIWDVNFNHGALRTVRQACYEISITAFGSSASTGLRAPQLSGSRKELTRSAWAWLPRQGKTFWRA